MTNKSTKPPMAHVSIRRGFPAQTHGSYVRRNLIQKVREYDDPTLNKVNTPEGDFKLYYADFITGVHRECNGILVVGPIRQAWYMGRWEAWLQRMKSIRTGQHENYEKFLNATCIFKTENIRLWL